MKKFPQYKQTEFKDCGPTCIKIIAQYYGKKIKTQILRSLSETTRQGSTLLGLSEAAETIGFHTLGVKLSLDKLKSATLPCIVHWNKIHYVVVYKIAKNKIHISDPGHGLIQFTTSEFVKSWTGDRQDEDAEGVALLFEPTPKFYQETFEEDTPFGFVYIAKYLLKYKQFVLQLLVGLLAASLIQLIFPFLTQSIVDFGIAQQDLAFIYLIFFAQLFLFLGRAALEIIQSWILLHLSTRINISLISDFFIKLMKLPISYFDVRMTGDLLQRINDHKRIEKVLTTSSLLMLFSCFNLIIFSFILAYYNFQIFTVFTIGSLFYFTWVTFFLKKRKTLDYKRFSEVSQEQDKVLELINGMQEIKLHNAERNMRWGWEYIQARLFRVATKSLSLEQMQTVGSNLINEFKNMVITVLAAKLVIEGEISLGMMMAISYIVGQLNSPIIQMIGFLRDVQDAKISLDRLGEVHGMPNEEGAGVSLEKEIPKDAKLELRNISFRYRGALRPVIDDLNMNIPANKITAIVGVSGSGKTTLMKLLLRFYNLDNGEILINGYNLNRFAQSAWRDFCGVVMQEGYIFNDSIAKNIAVGTELVDKEKLLHAAEVANILQFVKSLPQAFDTKLGTSGVGLSTGQKQRILIARAVYKDPQVLFFDEATSALDAKNEKEIVENLNNFFSGKTVVVIAHRLSTVKNADQIVVLDKGKVEEVGNHQSLINSNGAYYKLIKNQLHFES